MRWGFPVSLLLLAGVIPLILFLHSLRPKGAQVRTAVLFLWEKLLRERPVGKKLGWLLRNHLLLILQLLGAALLVAALADPSLLYYGAPAGNTVAVIDLSASMKAKGRLGSRFDEARRELLSLIDGMASDQAMTLVGAGPVPEVLAPFTGDKSRLRDLVRTLQPTDAPAPVKEAVLIGHSFLRRGSDDRVVVLSDTAFEGAEELPWNSGQLRLIRVDGGSRNVGITGFEIRRSTNGSRRGEIMIRIKNFASDPIGAVLALKMGERRLFQEKIELAPQEGRVLIFPYEGSLEGRAEAMLEIDDDLSTDNRAFLSLSESPPIRLLYVGKGNPFLDYLFRSLSNIRVTHVDRLTPDTLLAEIRQYDVVVVDGVRFPPVTEGNFLFINTVPEGLPLDVIGKISRPRLLPSAVRHPLIDGVRLDNLHIKEALHLIPRAPGVVLGSAREGPLVFALEKGRLKTLVLGFDLLASDLPLKIAFPVLLSNALDWFYPKRIEFPATSVQAGKPYPMYLQPTDEQVEVETPAGKREVLKAISNPLPFADTTNAGFYTFKSRSRAGQFAVNLFSESESQIAPRVSLPLVNTAQTKARDGGIETGFALWPSLLIVVLLLLGVEGLLVFRGIGGPIYPLVFHAFSLAALALALINPRILKPMEALDVVVSVDFSRSVGQEGMNQTLQVLEKARQVKIPDGRTGLLFFGRQPAWEFFPRSEFPTGDFAPSVEREDTDIQSALQAALAQVSEGRQGKILLISDGNENRGDAFRMVPLLRSRGVPVWSLPVHPSQGRNEVYLSDLILPQRVDSGEGFEVRAAVESQQDASARVRLLRDGVVQSERQLRLTAGTHWTSFLQHLSERGNHIYELLVESADDTFAENNLLQGIVGVKGPPRVLYLHAQDRPQRFFADALSAQGYSVIESIPDRLSLSLADLSAFDLLVLDNVPAYRLSQSKMEAIEKYVRDLGGGLLVIGGSQSYGAGGYFRTPLERVLPVETRPPSRLDFPHLALLFVLDKSGSMAAGPSGATKLDLAKAAAFAAADLLNPSDQVGILTFDAAWEWLLPFRQVGKGEVISERLSSVQSDGGTDLYKAMLEAYRSLTTKDAAIKHLIVFSDGLTDKADFNSLVEKMASDKITVSTVAIGQDADRGLMAAIAKVGNGRAYVTIDPQTIPQIFTTETLLISRDLLIEKPIYPTLVDSSGPLKGFVQKRIPPVRGYVLTYPKTNAELMMRVDKDPLLVSWRHGLGRVIAFTSDLSGRWGKEWVHWTDFPQWAGQLARSVMRKASDDRVLVEFHPEQDGVRVVADVLSKEGRFVNSLDLRGSLVGPDQKAQTTLFRQIAPGRYESRFSRSERGVYLLTIFEQKKDAAPVPAATASFVAPYPREYRELKANASLLSRLAEQTGGEVLDPEKLDEGLKRLFTPDPGKAQSARETWWTFSGLGLGLFIVGLAARRLPAVFERFGRRHLSESRPAI
jgi:uncharacterized membrane protein